MPTCKRMSDDCGFTGPIGDFKRSMGVYKDIHCPKCGTSRVDTSDVNAAWAAEGKVYGYGDNNTLVVSKADGPPAQTG